jgi:site-specific recombinase XerD
MSTRNFSRVAVLLETFFTDHLMKQRQVSQHTIASYRDTFRLLLEFAQSELGKPPASLTIDDLGVSLVKKFLAHLEAGRGVSPRTRNQRLAALRSCFRFAALYLPEKSQLIEQVLALPSKRYERRLVAFLTNAEVEALLAAPELSSWSGRRDYTLMLLAIQTGLRVSELRSLRRAALHLGTGAHLRCTGKGRKERCTPLTKETVAALSSWLKCIPECESAPIFSSARGGPLTSDGVQYILAKHASVAARRCPSLARKRVSPHVLRHTAAMRLLTAGVDCTVIALWLGHESVETTMIYLEADLKMKEQAIKKTSLPDSKPYRYQVPDKLLSFLTSL